MKKTGTPLIFDVDGTLWDTRAEIVEAWNDVFDARGCGRPVTLERLTMLMGSPMEVFVETFLPHVDLSVRGQIMHEAEQAENAHLKKTGRPCLYENTVETLRTLSKDHWIGIASNCQQGYIETFIECAGLEDVVDDHIAYGDTGKDKPENIRLLMERNGLDRTVYIGDTAADLRSCQSIGIPFIWAKYGFGENVCETGIDDISDLCLPNSSL